MTRQESFKRRIRAHMEKTGEKYTSTRAALIAKSSSAAAGHRPWVSQPEFDDDKIREATGRSWNQWCDLIEVELGEHPEHAAMVSLAQTNGTDGWWAQTVAVGYERITGLRLPNQRMDGTFTASKSRSLDLDVPGFRELLLDADARADLFPGLDTELRSKPESKALRIAIDEGSVLFSFDPAPNGRTRLTVTHERLSTPADVQFWKKYWEEWLRAIAEG